MLKPLSCPILYDDGQVPEPVEHLVNLQSGACQHREMH